MKVDLDVRIVLMRRSGSDPDYLERIDSIAPSPTVAGTMNVGVSEFNIDFAGSFTFTDVPETVEGFGIINLEDELLASRTLPSVAYKGDSVTIEGTLEVLDPDVLTSTLDDMTSDEMTMDEWLESCPEPDVAVEMAAAVDDEDEALEELVRWLRGETWSDFATSLVKFYDDRGFLSPKQVASATKMRVKVEAKRTKAPLSAPVTEDGMYLHPDGTVYKVQRAVHGSGHLYAKRLVVSTEYAEAAHFDFDPGAIRRLSPSMKMSLEQAQAFGSLYGVCCVCAAVLTNEQSIADGIGPVCRTRVF